MGLPGKFPESAIPEAGVSTDICNKVIDFDRHWRNEPKDNPNIWRVAANTLHKEITLLMFFTFIASTGRFLQAYISEQLIRNIRLSETPYLWFSVFIIMSLMLICILHWSWHLGYIFGMKVQFMFIGVIYKKIHSLSLNSIDRFSKGKIINIAA